TSVASLRLASNRYFRSAGKEGDGWRRKNLFINTTLFGKAAERVAARRKKGEYVLVRGRLELNEWIGEDGRTRRDYSIFAEEISSPGGGKRGLDKEPGADDEREEGSGNPANAARLN
ncbi:MAG: single-stranded DNA-binding protein, partial [Candidatus Hydrogenedentota bacterium]